MGGNKDVEYVYCVAKAKLFFPQKIKFWSRTTKCWTSSETSCVSVIIFIKTIWHLNKAERIACTVNNLRLEEVWNSSSSNN